MKNLNNNIITLATRINLATKATSCLIGINKATIGLATKVGSFDLWTRFGYQAVNQKKFYSSSTHSSFDESIKQELSNNVLSNFDNRFDTSRDLNLFIFSNLVDILENNPINHDTQIKIERLIFEQFNVYTSNKESPLVLGVEFSKFSGKFNEHCLNKVEEINIYLDKLKNNLNSNKKIDKDLEWLKGNLIYDYYLKEIINTAHFKDITSVMLFILFTVITFNDIIDPDGEDFEDDQVKTSLLSNSLKLGRFIVNVFIKKIYNDYTKNKNNPEITYKNFKESFLKESRNDILNSGEFYLHIGSKLIEIMVTCNMVSIKIVKRQDSSLAILKITDEISALLGRKNSVVTIPMNLPMIVKPKPYSEEDLGGYLLNGVEYDQPLFTKKIGYANNSEIDDDSIIYSVINNMMETPFKVNKDLLNYLLNYNHIHKLLINPEYVHKFADIKRNKYQEKEYQKFMSEKILQEYIIKIAYTYSNMPEIYFPIKLDNRGRLYPISPYFHYQGSELAKALLLFAKADIIKRNDTEAIEYLKAYGATCFGNGLNRKSYSKRLEWVEDNWEKIIDFENSDLVGKAEEKFLFISFCIEMKRFNNFLNNEYIHEFKTYLPIQLDGTCNGFQHLALLSNETELFETLNLFEAKKSDDPKDFYGHIITILNVHLENKKSNSKITEEIDSYDRLLKLGISRSNVKPVIMTKPYNAKDKTLVKYIKDTLIYSHLDKRLVKDKDGNYTTENIGWYKLTTDSEHYVNYLDIELLVKCINEVIYVNYPRIKLLSIYLRDITKILNKLDLPIIWRLPTGLKISQKYLERRSKQIKPFSHLNTSLKLTITDKIKIDKLKQGTALMPNLVHSLDASTLSLLYNSLYNSVDTENVNFYSVHDCYGVTAKYVGILINLLSTIYIDIYSDKGYIQKFDQDIINHIMISYGEEKSRYDNESRTIHLDKKKIRLPALPDGVNDSTKKLAYKRLANSLFLVK